MENEKYDYNFQARVVEIRLDPVQEFTLMVVTSTKNERVAVAMSGVALAKVSETIRQILEDYPQASQWRGRREN